MRSLYSAVGESLHPALSNESVPADAGINPEMKNPVRALFLCTHNSARSQMAEGILRSRSDGQIEVFSAGTEATRVYPLAIRAMQDLHIDISSQYSKSLTQFIDQDFDYIITVCDRAKDLPAVPRRPGPYPLEHSRPCRCHRIRSGEISGFQASQHRVIHAHLLPADHDQAAARLEPRLTTLRL